MEFKTRITTHDVLTYSAKARKHKEIYPYLRYGMVATDEARVPGRFVTHNEALDFCIGLKGLSEKSSNAAPLQLIDDEIGTSHQLEEIVFGKGAGRIFRTAVVSSHSLAG